MTDPVSEAHAEWMRRGWDDAAEGMATVLDLLRAHRILTDRIALILKPFELSFASYELLMLLSFTRRGSLSIGHLGRLLQVHSTSVSSTVDRLEAGNLVERVRANDDRRVVTARITPQGRRLAGSATSVLNDSVFETLGLSKAQGVHLWSVLRALRANAGDFDVVSNRTGRTGERQ